MCSIVLRFAESYTDSQMSLYDELALPLNFNLQHYRHGKAPLRDGFLSQRTFPPFRNGARAARDSASIGSIETAAYLLLLSKPRPLDTAKRFSPNQIMSDYGSCRIAARCRCPEPTSVLNVLPTTRLPADIRRLRTPFLLSHNPLRHERR